MIYRITTGRRELKPVNSISPMEAAKEAAIRMGARAEELVVLGPDKVSWFGATFQAIHTD